jgi:hypothetical protein
VARAEPAICDQILDVRREMQEALEIEYRRTILTRTSTELFGVQAELSAEALESHGGLDGVEVLSLNILDESYFEELVVGYFAYDDGDRVNFGEFGGTPSPFASDKLIAAVDLADHQGLNDAACPNRLGQFSKAFGLKYAPRLKGIGIDFGDRKHLGAAVIGRAGRIGDSCRTWG